jgi:Cu/Ag efflux protein CusF
MKKWIATLALICTASTWATTEWVPGEVVKLAPEKAQVTLKHGPIKSLGMDGMTMPYKVTKEALLKGFKPGDIVRFSVELKNQEMLVNALEHTK